MGYEGSLAVDEKQVLVLHPHWKPLLWPVVATVIAAEILIPLVSDASPAHVSVTVVVAVPLMWWLIYSLLKWRTSVYEVTTQRIRISTGVITHANQEVPLSAITDVSIRKGLLDRFLGSGTLVVETAGGQGGLTLPEVPHVESVQSTLSAAHVPNSPIAP